MIELNFAEIRNSNGKVNKQVSMNFCDNHHHKTYLLVCIAFRHFQLIFCWFTPGIIWAKKTPRQKQFLISPLVIISVEFYANLNG